MAGSPDNKSHTEVIKELRRLFAEQYPDGGVLPPGREMAARLGVSNPTYLKALKAMVGEGWVSAIPRGHRVTPSHLRFRKVGLVVADGLASPFIAKEFPPVVQLLEAGGFRAQLIQAASVDKLQESAIVRGVEALLWLSPSPRVAKVIGRIHAAGDLPQVLTQPNEGFDRAALPPGVGLVCYSRELSDKLRAEFMVARGHRQLLYISDPNPGRASLAAAFRRLGVELGPGRCLDRVADCPGKLSRLLRHHQITGIVSDGGAARVDELLAELSGLPAAARPELLLSNFPELDQLAARHPGTSFFRMACGLEQRTELVAVQMLLRHMLGGEPLGTAVAGTNTRIVEG